MSQGLTSARSIFATGVPLPKSSAASNAAATQLSRLVVIGSENQIAAGDNNKQAKVTGSENVNISIS